MGCLETLTNPLVTSLVGNPLTYYNGSSYSFVWEEGRQLAGVTSGSNTIAYKYNQDGVRIEKTVGTLRYEYTVSGTRIEREKLFDGSTLKKDSYFYYDASGIPSSAQIFVYENGVATEYNFILESNIQGDITDIYTADGTLVASLTYNAWGQIRVKYTISDWTLSNLAIDIPFKYRGYYYDTETGFYYLNSRYYDPYMMRFINADGYISTGQGLNGNNMYLYCNNNPVMYVDPNGEFLILTLLAISPIIVAVGTPVATTAATSAIAFTAVNHIASGIQYANVDSKVEENYTKEEAKEAIEEITGEDTVTFGAKGVNIKDSYEISSRYDRIMVSKIIKNTVDEDGVSITNRTTYGFSAEWLGHNIAYNWDIIRNERTKDVDLDYDFSTNDNLTKIGTIGLIILGVL